MSVSQERTVSFLLISTLIFAYTGLTNAYISDKDQVFDFKAESQDSIWPLPRFQSITTNQLLTLNPVTFRFVTWPTNASDECDIIREALRRYAALLKREKTSIKDPKLPELRTLNVTVQNFRGPEFCGFPRFESDETYNLTVYHDPPQARLTSHTVWGLLRGLETFSQMIYQDNENKSCLLKVSEIQDGPRFAHRGVLLDTARHFIPLKILKKNLDAMAYNKLNVFHWHIVDDQSFPFESKVYPNLTLLGAYSHDRIYKQEEIKDIIQYARLRGIRVIPEFDTPFHTRSIGKAFPDLLTSCNTIQLFSYKKVVSPDGLNPSLEKTYNLVRDILQEFKQVFSDEYIHLGMDEANIGCWIANPDIIKFMDLNSINNSKLLEQYYARRVINITQSLNYKYIIWEDPIENGVEVSSETIVQIWKGGWTQRAQVVSGNGHHMILSSCWYIDLIVYGDQWESFYECDPLTFSMIQEELDLMLGGEACLWSEYVDATNLLQSLWPSASAVAERLWNGGENLKPDGETRRRFDQNRCRMLRRGIEAKPVYSGFCYDDTLDADEGYKEELLLKPKQDDFFIWIPIIASLCGCLCILQFSKTILKRFILQTCIRRGNRTISNTAHPKNVNMETNNKNT